MIEIGTLDEIARGLVIVEETLPDTAEVPVILIGTIEVTDKGLTTLTLAVPAILAVKAEPLTAVVPVIPIGTIEEIANGLAIVEVKALPETETVPLMPIGTIEVTETFPETAVVFRTFTSRPVEEPTTVRLANKEPSVLPRATESAELAIMTLTAPVGESTAVPEVRNVYVASSKAAFKT